MKQFYLVQFIYSGTNNKHIPYKHFYYLVCRFSLLKMIRKYIINFLFVVSIIQFANLSTIEYSTNEIEITAQGK